MDSTVSERFALLGMCACNAERGQKYYERWFIAASRGDVPLLPTMFKQVKTDCSMAIPTSDSRELTHATPQKREGHGI
jgi:hypothetical protein